MKSQLILIPSSRMDKNSKKDRNEDQLIRMGQIARENLELTNEKEVELWPDKTVEDRISRSRVLKIFQAFAGDLKEAKGNLNSEEYDRVGFVTKRTFDYICGPGINNDKNIWIADEISDTVIGADPEFILTDGNILHYAANYMDHNGDLGSDGSLAELRPAPAIGVDMFVENIRAILTNKNKTKPIAKLDWIAACCPNMARSDNGRSSQYPVGGHVHVGTPRKIADKLEKDSAELFKHSMFSTMNKCLDDLVGVPALKFDDKGESIARRLSYGKYGQYRDDHNRLEYRTLSGMWMAHPKLALAVLGAVKAVTESFFLLLETHNLDREYLSSKYVFRDKYYRNGYQAPAGVTEITSPYETFAGWKDMPILKDLGATASSTEVRNALHKYEITFNKDYIGKISEAYRNLPMYDHYREYIEMFLELISLPHKEIVKMNKDIKETWTEDAAFII